MGVSRAATFPVFAFSNSNSVSLTVTVNYAPGTERSASEI